MLFFLYLTDPSIRLIADLNRDPINLAEDELGLVVDKDVFEEAKTKVGSWTSPL